MGFFDLFRKKSLTPIDGGSVWQPIVVNEPFAGAWQSNQELKRTDLLTYHAVFACLSLIAADVGKLRFNTKRAVNGVLTNTHSKASRVFKKPNNFQTWQQFAENWVNSKTTRGNTYIWKQRDVFGDIWQLNVLNPDRVKPLISDNGEVFYQISRDKLFNIDQDVIMPASEIIHDRYNCLYHPLVGLSPITACAVSAGQGMAIQSNQTILFNNASRPSGILTVPTSISEAKAKEIKNNWNANYAGLNQGGIGVLGDGVKYEAITVTSSDAQLLEQLKLTGEIVCSVFHVPAFKVGLGTIPSGQKTTDLQEIYYSDCLQTYIESMENLLDTELDLEEGVEIEAELKSLIRMDSTSQIDYLAKGTGSGIISPNEARAELGYSPVIGGESPLLQQQNYSLEALAKRDAQDNPFDTSASAQSTPQETPKSVQKPSFDDIYKGVFNSEMHYEKGDFVTKKGGLWVALSDTKGDFDHKNWKLVSKNGGEQ